MSYLKLFSWVNSARRKPLMDSYHAPYKPKHCYWPGLLLVLHFLFLLVFALNYQRDLSIHLLAILVKTRILQLWAWVSGGVYENWCLDALFICSQLDHCPTFRRQSACSWVHLCLCSCHNIHCNPCLSHLPAIEAD